MVSELEHVVLGVVGIEQPCTAYRIRRTFEQSPSGHWSGSAGAIYPLVRRLRVRGLLTASPRAGDGRSTLLYRLTPKGRKALTTWLRPPLPEVAALMTLDPLRVRIRFLEALPEADRLAFVTEAQAKLRHEVGRISREAVQARSSGDPYLHLAHRGALHALRAQLKLLDDARGVLTDCLDHAHPVGR